MGYIYTKSGKLAKRLYFGAVLLFEGLYYTFKNRVLADGGTFVENELPTISQDAKLVLTPNAYKAGKLYSAVPDNGTGDFTVDRNSTATYIDEDGIIRTALANVPRIEDGALLVEPQSTNLLPYSNAFSGSSWSDLSTNITRVFGQISPDGTANATRITAIGGAVSHRLRVNNVGTLTANFDYTNSVYIKRVSGVGNIVLYTTDGKQQLVTTATSEWVKYEVSSFSTDLSIRWYLSILDDGDTIDVWGAQVEEGTEATSYIPTNGSTVTRLADDISVPTLAGVTSITETINGVEQTPITTIPATYSLPAGNINKVTML